MVNSNSVQEQVGNKEKDNSSGKRMLGKKGREAPKFENDDVIDDNWFI